MFVWLSQVIILARECGLQLELDDIKIDKLLPDSLQVNYLYTIESPSTWRSLTEKIKLWLTSFYKCWLYVRHLALWTSSWTSFQALTQRLKLGEKGPMQQERWVLCYIVLVLKYSIRPLQIRHPGFNRFVNSACLLFCAGLAICRDSGRESQRGISEIGQTPKIGPFYATFRHW